MAQRQPERRGAGATLAAPRMHRGEPIDQREVRGVLGTFATGITVVTAAGASRRVPHGITANAFSSVSLDPPLVLVCIDREAVMHQSIEDSGSFAVSVLHGCQEDAARHFADRNRPRGIAQFDSVDWVPGRCTGAPLLVGGLAWLECELETTYDGGDHSIFIGRVLDIAHSGEQDALLFFGGCYHRLVA
jgi:flavin reductase (DIM6/NTAB) family NADH-FMN oxidoreductase RutF